MTVNYFQVHMTFVGEVCIIMCKCNWQANILFNGIIVDGMYIYNICFLSRPNSITSSKFKDFKHKNKFNLI